MRRTSAAFFLAFAVGCSAAACSTGGSGQTAGPGGGTVAPTTAAGGGATAAPTTGGGGGNGGQGILDAAKAAIGHACQLLPTDLVATIVPSPGPPQEELFPARCSVFSDTVAIAFSLDVYSKLDKPQGSEDVSGLGQAAYLEKLAPGNWTLWVALTPDVGNLFVEVNNQDGKDHLDEAVSLAKAILQRLGGS